jgi:N-acetylneuraminic acid mutarotase
LRGFILGLVALAGLAGGSQPVHVWHELPQLPESLAGQCVGTVGNLLVVAGGSKWTKPPWDGGTKLWSDEIFALAPGTQQWQMIGHLPRPMGYGSAVQAGKTLLCIGGQDAEHTFSTTLQLSLDGHGIRVNSLPDLTRPVTNASAALIDHKVYLVGGQHSLHPKDVSREIWSLNLSDSKWKQEPSPAWQHARILPVVAGCGGDLYVASGADLVVDAGDTFHRTYLSDAWRLKRGAEWERLPDTPSPVAGAPSVCDPSGSLVIFGGDNGSLAAQIPTLKDQHPGFSLKTLRFDPHDSTWSTVSQLPLSLVTTGATYWEGQYVIAGGENKPGHRSNRVIGSNITH